MTILTFLFLISDSVVIDSLLLDLKFIFNQLFLPPSFKSSLEQVKFIFEYKEFHMVFKNEFSKAEWSAFEFKIT